MAVENATYIENLSEYQMTMQSAFRLHELKIINDADLALIEEKTAAKYCIKANSIFRRNDLL